MKTQSIKLVQLYAQTITNLGLNHHGILTYLINTLEFEVNQIVSDAIVLMMDQVSYSRHWKECQCPLITRMSLALMFQSVEFINQLFVVEI